MANHREAQAALEQRVHEEMSRSESISRELVKAQSELSEAAHTESALKEAVDRAKQQSVEQAAAMQEELAVTRRHWEERLAVAMAENQRLARQLLDAQRELQAANGRWETHVQTLQHSILQCFQQTMATGRQPLATAAASASNAAATRPPPGPEPPQAPAASPGGRGGPGSPPNWGSQPGSRSPSRSASRTSVP